MLRNYRSVHFAKQHHMRTTRKNSEELLFNAETIKNPQYICGSFFVGPPGLEPELNPPKGLVLAITLWPEMCRERESNPRRYPLQGYALPLSYRGLCVVIKDLIIIARYYFFAI